MKSFASLLALVTTLGAHALASAEEAPSPLKLPDVSMTRRIGMELAAGYWRRDKYFQATVVAARLHADISIFPHLKLWAQLPGAQIWDVNDGRSSSGALLGSPTLGARGVFDLEKPRIVVAAGASVAVPIDTSFLGTRVESVLIPHRPAFSPDGITYGIDLTGRLARGSRFVQIGLEFLDVLERELEEDPEPYSRTNSVGRFGVAAGTGFRRHFFAVGEATTVFTKIEENFAYHIAVYEVIDLGVGVRRGRVSTALRAFTALGTGATTFGGGLDIVATF